MDCDKYNDLMMKYMDGLLDDFDMMNLKMHIALCPCCKEDFDVYTGILKDFDCKVEPFEIVEAPKDFAINVMKQVEGINIYFPKVVRDKGKVLDNIIFAAWGLMVGAFSLATLMLFYNYQIFSWLYDNGFYGAYDALSPIAGFMQQLGDIVGYYSNDILLRFESPNMLYGAPALYLLAALALAALFMWIVPKKSMGRKRV